MCEFSKNLEIRNGKLSGKRRVSESNVLTAFSYRELNQFKNKQIKTTFKPQKLLFLCEMMRKEIKY